jgi:hypothetical protein
MGTTASISSVGSTECREFIAHEMLVAGTTMATSTIDSYLVYKIAFFQRR